MATLKAPPQNIAHYEKASAQLLADQPAVDPANGLSAGKEWQILRGHLESRLISLRNWRTSWWTQNWSDLAQYIEPRRSIWLTQSTGGMPSPNSMTRGRPINSSIVDPTGTYAVRVCSGGMVSGLASQSRPWFQIVPSVKDAEIDEDGRNWLDDVEERIYTVLAGSNFYNSFAQEIEDLVVFGTAPVIIYEDEQDVLRCYNPVTGEYYLGTNAQQRVDGLYRLYVMTVSQIVDFFGIENCPGDVVSLWNQKGAVLETERLVAHSIEPNFGIGNQNIGKVPGKFAWREVYWVYGSGSEKPLSFKGFIEQPFTASRWSIQSNDAYGRSVGMDVLPDIIQLQVETMRKAEAIEKQVRPPLIADMQLKNQPSSILPGNVTYVNSLSASNGMRPIYNVNPDIGAMERDLAAIQERIKIGFFLDLFLMMQGIDRERVTAYEVAQKLQEKLAVIGPVIENLLNESLKPRLKRVFAIMDRRGLIPPKPESLKKIPLTIDFVSMLALAQKAAATGGIERLMAFAGNLVAVAPTVMDNIDTDAAVRTMSDLLGNKEKILNAVDKRDAIRAQRAQQQAAQQQEAMMAQGMQTAKVGADAAKVLSDTQIGGGQTALNGLFGG